jgi:predicted glycosyltransferase
MFYPLHFEPEGVLNYGAYFFDNQNELINNILKCIGENRILIVKEHPQQPGFLLQKEYLNLKKRYSNLVFCRSEESSIKLINRSILMLTLGGTSGFEALALGKKVVNFGSVFYDAFEDVININSFQELYKYLRYNKEFPIKGDLVSYTARIFSILKKGDPHPNLNLISNQNINYITNAIEEQLV